MTDSSAGEWLLLLFFLPSKQAQARVQAWRRLQRVGAVLLKHSAYVVPASPESREDFEWIRNEIVAAGGEASVLIAKAPNQATSDEIGAAFRAVRSRDFETLAAEASGILARAPKRRPERGRALTQRVRRLRERFEAAVRLDFFGTPQQENVAALLSKLDQLTGRKPSMAVASPARADRRQYTGRVWLTRPHPGVDRMSSAWLIQRFVDSSARFIFGDPAKRRDAIPFDTFEAEFGHHGSHCTFETLCERFGISDPAARRIGRIVHDLDLKESKYSEPEAATVGRLVEGLRRSRHDDDALLRSGMEMFEALYQSMAATTATSRPGRSAGSPPRSDRRRRRSSPTRSR